MELRELQSDDQEALLALFRSIEPTDRAFFKDDLNEPEILRRWLGDERGVRLAGAGEDGLLEAVAAVWPGVGGARHVGDLRLIVAPDSRGRGLGKQMARGALIAALERGMSKITVEVIASQQGTIDMFLGLGFTPEALLRDELRGADGETEDVILVSHFSDEAAQDVILATPEHAG